jgi:hypothetical protein
MLQVFSDAPDEAQRSLTKALDEDYQATLKPTAWVLASKINERYGLADAALSASEKAATCTPSDEIGEWALSLIKTGKIQNDRVPPPQKASEINSTPRSK